MATPDGHFDGYHSCPCCGEILCGGLLSQPLCASCFEDGCEPEEDGEDEGVYLDCQVQRCPSCDERFSFMSDGEWHPNCDDPKACAQAWQEEKEASDARLR